MNNLHEYSEFKNKKRGEKTTINEGAQLFPNDVWKVRTRIEIPQSLINSYIKKVKDETGEDLKAKWSFQELAEEIANFITNSYMSIENLPTSMTSSVHAQPVIQTQEDMPTQTQVQGQAQAAQGQATQGQGQSTQGQGQSTQGQGQAAQGTAQGVPQTQAPTGEI